MIARRDIPPFVGAPSLSHRVMSPGVVAEMVNAAWRKVGWDVHGRIVENGIGYRFEIDLYGGLPTVQATRLREGKGS